MRVRLTCGHRESHFDFPNRGTVDVATLLAAALRAQPELAAQWCDGDGRLRPHLPVFVNGDHVRYHSGLDTPLGDGDAVIVIARVAGG